MGKSIKQKIYEFLKSIFKSIFQKICVFTVIGVFIAYVIGDANKNLIESFTSIYALKILVTYFLIINIPYLIINHFKCNKICCLYNILYKWVILIYKETQDTCLIYITYITGLWLGSICYIEYTKWIDYGMHIALGYVLLIFFHLLYNVDKTEEPSNTEKQSNNTEQSNNKSIKCLKLLITIAALLYLNCDFLLTLVVHCLNLH